MQRLDLEWAGSKLEMGLQDIAKTVSSEVRKSLSEKLSEIRSLVPQLAATTLGYERAGNFTRKVSGADLEDILYSSLGS